MTPGDALHLARPKHWLKNAIVLLPVLFARKMDEPAAWLEALLAAAAFCLASSGIYALNDVVDRNRDRLHPAKRTRPVASGRVLVSEALAESGLLLIAGLVLAAGVGRALLGVLVAYVLLQLAYSFVLKHKMIVDVMCIALGFVFRAVAGAAAIGVEPSPWLIICTFTLCLFIGFCKRCNEIASLTDKSEAWEHRNTLAGYTDSLLTHLITLSGAIAVVAFLIYSASAHTVKNLGTNFLLYTLPFVIYGVCRFAMLSMLGRYSDPTEIIVKDRALQLTGLFWTASVIAIIRWGVAARQWLHTQF